jgi:hypothetical protein
MLLHNSSRLLKKLLPAGLLIIGMMGCKLTEKNVTGTWVSNFSDTLHVYTDHSFLAVPRHSSRDSGISGEWVISPASLSLYETGTNQKQRAAVFCGGLSKMGGYYSRTRLVNPWVCNTPSHRFISFRKLR